MPYEFLRRIINDSFVDFLWNFHDFKHGDVFLLDLWLKVKPFQIFLILPYMGDTVEWNKINIILLHLLDFDRPHEEV